MEIFKVLAVIFITTVLCVILKQYKPEYTLLVALCGGIITLTYIISHSFSSLKLIEQKIMNAGIDNSYFKIALKALGIGYITSFIADSCRDAGQSALALKAEIAGKCAIFLLSVPLVLNILETAIGFIK